MDALLVLVLLVALAAAALRWAHEDRPGFAVDDLELASARLEGLRHQAYLESRLPRQPGLARRAAARLGDAMVMAGSRMRAYGESVVVPSRLPATSRGSIHSGL